MALEYILLLSVSALLLVGSFGVNTGPVKMFSQSSPILSFRLERRLTTGYDFFTRNTGAQKSVGWKRK